MSPLVCSYFDTFQRDGFCVLRSHMSPSLADHWVQLSRGYLRHARFVTGFGGPLGELWKHPNLIDIARDIIGSEPVLFMNRILLKDQQWNQAVSVHQDYPYFDPNWGNKLSIFVPLAPVNADNGGLFFVKGSPKHGVMERGTIQLEKFPVMPHECPDLQPGDIVLMDFLTWHYSLKGTSSAERPLMQIVYRASETRSSYLAPMIPCKIEGCVSPDL